MAAFAIVQKGKQKHLARPGKTGKVGDAVLCGAYFDVLHADVRVMAGDPTREPELCGRCRLIAERELAKGA